MTKINFEIHILSAVRMVCVCGVNKQEQPDRWKPPLSILWSREEKKTVHVNEIREMDIQHISLKN